MHIKIQCNALPARDVSESQGRIPVLLRSSIEGAPKDVLYEKYCLSVSLNFG